eukprot:GHVT01099727.1.p1 GENE.GHVT01099727.1~~GHVT01099727.1.p1  ORF type:complete len:155 (+),score=21.73 GHVT01099727.1:335-799(+)
MATETPSPASSPIVDERKDVVKGSCKWFNSKKGYGFLTMTTGEDIFVHQSEIKSDGFRNLAEGEAVEFEVAVDDVGKRKAVKVSGPDFSNVQGDQARFPRYRNGVRGRGGMRGRGRGGGRREKQVDAEGADASPTEPESPVVSSEGPKEVEATA